MSQRKSVNGYAFLKSQYFSLCGAIRKVLTGNGRNTDNTAAEVLIATATVRVENSKRIYFKDSVANLRATLEALKAQPANA